MDDSRHLEPPGPGDASDLAGLAGRANELWQWAGSPTEETLGSRLGTRHTGRGFVTEKLPTGTLARILAGESVGWVVIEPFIVACLRCGRRAEDQINMYLGIWRPVWTTAEQAADAAGDVAVFRGEPVTGQTPAVRPPPNSPPTGATPAQPPSVAGPPPSATTGPPVTPPTPPVAFPPHPTGSQPSVGPVPTSLAPPAGAAPTTAGPSTGSTPTTPIPPGSLPPPSVPQLPPTPPAPPRSIPPPSLETDATQPIPRPAPPGPPGPPPPRQGPPPAFPQGPRPAPPPEYDLGGPPPEPPVPSLPGTWSSSEPPPRRSSQRSPALIAVALSMVAVVAVVVSVAALRHKSDSGGHGTAASGDSRTLNPSDLAGDNDLLTASSQPSSTAQASGSATPTPTPSASATPSPTATGGTSSAPGTTAGAPPSAGTFGGGAGSSSPGTPAAPPPAKTTAAPPPAKTTTPPPPPPPTVCTPSGCAGKSYFVALGEHLWVCDQKPDGYAAVAEYTRTDVPNQNNVAWNRNGNGSCIDHNMNMPEGAKITFRVCLGNSDGKLFSCSGRITTTA